MDTSYSIRLGIEDQAAVEKAFAAIGEAGKTALATVRGAAGTASSGLGAVSDGASEIAHGFDVVVMLHGDGQYAPEKMEYLLEPIYQGKADHVFGSRMTGDPRAGGMPIHRYLGNKFLTTVENWMLGWNLSEYHSGYRIYMVNALKKIPFERCSGEYHFDSQILVQIRMAGLRVVERTIPTFYGSEKCYVPLFKYGKDVLKTMIEYVLHVWGIKKSAYLEIDGPIAKTATPAVRM